MTDQLSPEENPGLERPPAFPSKFRVVKKNPISNQTVVHDVLNLGLSKREFFAAIALQGLLANSQPGQWAERIEKMAVQHADLLIYELERAEKQEEKQNDSTEG